MVSMKTDCVSGSEKKEGKVWDGVRFVFLSIDHLKIQRAQLGSFVANKVHGWLLSWAAPGKAGLGHGQP